MKMYVSTFFLWFVISLGAVANAKNDPVKLIVPAYRFFEAQDELEEGYYDDACGGAGLSAFSDGTQEVLDFLRKNGFEILESNGVLGIPPDEAMLEPLTSLLRYYEKTYSLALENLENPPTRKSQEDEVYVFQSKYAELREDGGFEILEDSTPGQIVYRPGHSGADAGGILRLGNVNVAKEWETLREAYEMRQFVDSLIEAVEASLIDLKH